VADKYLFATPEGDVVEREASTASAGAGSAGKIAALGVDGRLDLTMMPTGVGASTKLVPASGALSAGDVVNLFDDAGTLSARRADATTAGTEAKGFVVDSFADGASALVYLSGVNSARTGLTQGARYFLSTTAGGITTTAPTGSGNRVQIVGHAISDTELQFNPQNICVRA
jgi:hypothetical protein